MDTPKPDSQGSDTSPVIEEKLQEEKAAAKGETSSCVLSLEAVEAICSRICHDVINPLWAANNGFELLQEQTEADREQLITLIEENTRSAQTRLKLFRTAFGRDTPHMTDEILKTMKTEAEAYLLTKNIILKWPDEASFDPSKLRPKIFKFALNLILCMTEILPIGGDLRIETILSPSGQFTMNIKAYGSKCRFPDGFQEALNGQKTPHTITPPYAHALLVSGLRDYFKARFDFPDPQTQTDTLTLSFHIPLALTIPVVLAKEE